MMNSGAHLWVKWRNRLGVFAATVLMLQMVTSSPAFAQTSSTTGVTVNVVDTGSFKVELAADGIVFTTEDGSDAAVTAFSGATVSATLPIAISDTRSDATRAGYSVNLKMGALTVGDGSLASMKIDPANIRVTGVSGLPDGLKQSFEGAASLGRSVTLFGTEGVAPAIESSMLSATLVIEIPAGTMPGAFSGEISIEVIPAGI